jgi:hypothetical protein
MTRCCIQGLCILPGSGSFLIDVRSWHNACQVTRCCIQSQRMIAEEDHTRQRVVLDRFLILTDGAGGEPGAEGRHEADAGMTNDSVLHTRMTWWGIQD